MAKRHEFSFPAIMEKNRRKNKEYITVSFVTNTDREIVSEFNTTSWLRLLEGPSFFKDFRNGRLSKGAKIKENEHRSVVPSFFIKSGCERALNRVPASNGSL